MLYRNFAITVLIFFSITTFASKSFIIYYQENENFLREKGLAFQESGPSESKMIVEVDDENIDEFIAELKADNQVISFEENLIMTHFWEPGDDNEDHADRYYDDQWSLENSFRGINMPEAWDISKGEKEVVVAVLDTGLLPDLDDLENVLPGADLITRVDMAADGDARDLDPTDPGDWHYASEFEGCKGEFEFSSWHGSHVASIIAAKANNKIGIAGVAPEVSLLPVRVLGKCGGEMDDVADGIRWAAGGRVPGLPLNENPADVINLSLGARGECGHNMQSAIDFARSRNIVVVVASGNNNENLDYRPMVPAVCRGVISTGSTDQFGERSWFTNFGQQVDVVAPGGRQPHGLGVMGISNSGKTNASYNIIEEKSGTSMAAPHVSGVVALIKSIAPDLYPDQIEGILKDTAYGISGTGMGYGLINANDALIMALGIEPDSSYKTEEIIIERKPTSANAPRYVYPTHEFDEGGGSCGTIDFVDGGGSGGSGSGGNGLPFSFLFTLLIGIAVVKLPSEIHRLL